MKFLIEYNLKERKKLKEIIDKTIKDRKKEIEIFEENFIFPLKRLIKIAEDVKFSKKPIDVYLKENENFSKWLIKFLKNGRDKK